MATRHIPSWFGVTFGLAFVLLAACETKKDTDARCAEGEFRECSCPDDEPSQQYCSAQRQWGPCVCSDIPAPDAGGEAGTSGSGGGAGGQSGTGADDDAGMSVGGNGGTGGGGGGADAGVDAGGTDAAAAGDPYGPCTTTADCGNTGTCITVSSLPATHYCAASCTADNECPAAPGGATAKPSCIAPTLGAAKSCALVCDVLTMMCPGGMSCTPLGLVLTASVCTN